MCSPFCIFASLSFFFSVAMMAGIEAIFFRTKCRSLPNCRGYVVLLSVLTQSRQDPNTLMLPCKVGFLGISSAPISLAG